MAVSFSERENRRKNSKPVETILSAQPKEDDNKNKEEKKEVKARTFYLEPHHIKALAFKKAETGKDLSEIVRNALDDYFGDEIKKYK